MEAAMDLIKQKVGKSYVAWLPLNEEKFNRDQILETWKTNNFIFKEEREGILGLRPPQLGGIYAALGYDKSDKGYSATVIMPTGTGKTETILSIIIAGKFNRTLVVVPSDALRSQTAKKIIEYGLLRQFGLIDSNIQNPIVAVLNHGIKNDQELDRILESNVIIASAPALSFFPEEYLVKLTSHCSHLIIDEAHHVVATTWSRVKEKFPHKSVFQFTATPFRTDGSRIEGKIVFNYPLKKAQLDGYFKAIEFHPVREFLDEKSDRAIAEKSVSLLRQDLSAGLDHILMARAYPIKRAEEIFNIYSEYKDLNPILVSSKTKEKSKVIQDIKSGQHRAIICVDMLGEGFDLPQLKICAIHDPHKSINVMLQFTGRFTRNISNVGTAKFIANIANVNVNESLDELYKEDSDWNDIISDISSKKIENEKEYQAFRGDFTEPGKLLDLGLMPSISTVVFNMSFSKWAPDNFIKFGSKHFNIYDRSINEEKNIIIFSVKTFSPVGWTTSKEFYDELWDLYIVYFDIKNNLLFIHSSAKDGLVTRLMNLIAKNAVKIQGEKVFRTMAGLKRLKLQNVGLNKHKKGLRYSMHTGTEINDQIPDIEANRATKSNIFGKGYENGKPVSIGCSYKGKIWSMDSDSVDQWINWCDSVGKKILDNTIDTNAIMKTAMQMVEIEIFPDSHVIAVEWPVFILRKNESKLIIATDKWEDTLIHCELLFSHFSSSKRDEFTFEIRSSKGLINVNVNIIAKGDVVFSCSENVNISFGSQKLSLVEFFNEYPPLLYLEDTSFIDGGLHIIPNENYQYIYSLNNIEEWDWSGIDISVESQTDMKLTHSVQYRTINKLLNDYDFVFDDDGTGEVADIVAIKNINDSELVIHLYHCKYCPAVKGVATPGSRVDDVYQVSGQAVKSVKWFADNEKLLLRLIEREKKRLEKGLSSRIEKGSFTDLTYYAKIARYTTFKHGVAIVQPAISKGKVSNEILTLLGSTEAYLDEISGVKLKVITSN